MADPNYIASLKNSEKSLADSVASRETYAANHPVSDDFKTVTSKERARLKEVRDELARLAPQPAASVAETPAA